MSVKITIKLNEDDIEFNLYNFQFWNQRMFCLGMSSEGQLKRFITTKGFDKLLVSGAGGYFSFKKQYFNPYLKIKNRELDIYTESQLIEKDITNFSTIDVGPNNFTDHYSICADLGLYRDNIYFETKVFEIDGFDLYKYQTDDLYYIQNQSKNRDNELPILIQQFNEDVFGKINIIHGVDLEGNDYFDFQSLIDICNSDIGFSSNNSFYSIIRALEFRPESKIKSSTIIHETKIGCLNFIKLNEILPFKLDCGKSYIEKNILHKLVKRKHCFRYLYEYYNFINIITSNRRKIGKKSKIGKKEQVKFDIIPVFEKNDMLNFKIIMFEDMWTISKKSDLSNQIMEDPIFSINGYYDYKMGEVKYYDFETTKELIKYIKDNIGIAESIKTSKIIGEWFSQTYGYSPRQIMLPMILKANSKPICDKLIIYSIPEFENDECYYSSTFVNLYQFLAIFGLHINGIRSVLKMNEYPQSLFKKYCNFQVYHICRDIRRGLFLWNEDAQLDSCMININDAIKLINMFAHDRDNEKIKKNSYWFTNANNLLQSFPDTPGNIISETYQPPSLKVYMESKDDKED